MDFYSMTDAGIGKEVGHRIKRLRLQKNLTQAALSSTTGLSLNAIKSLESGKGKLSTLISILRELHVLDNLNNFIPDIQISPLQQARLGKQRERASGKRIKTPKEDPSDW
ncbi:MAG: helix-turn-helix transcriptional regulator [Proteobacteria bacterium]|nr:helix-turn-helix transcriptional regulator [Pseudomonadota bacterium]MBU1581896.1 helix-turn-helix transcriptional regulator [Pseudomonadota bacterium]MBU2628774.1 helix-turn-helix transcriptional regulator [Pseudomonadota bacterium]